MALLTQFRWPSKDSTRVYELMNNKVHVLDGRRRLPAKYIISIISIFNFLSYDVILSGGIYYLLKVYKCVFTLLSI